jgi:hypothetical protein
MGKIVKPAGTRALAVTRGTMHGSRNERAAMKLSGKIARGDEKPSGFLSRKPRP